MTLADVGRWIIEIFSKAKPQLAAPDYYLDAHQMATVARLRPFYESAVQMVVGIPWEVLAAIHYRESEFACKMSGGEAICGPYAFDVGNASNSERENLEGYVERCVKAVCAQYNLPYQTLNNDFRLASVVAANEFKTKMRGDAVRDGRLTDEVVADAFWGYNGRSKYHTADGNPNPNLSTYLFSPYVSNDPKRGVVLRLRGTIPDGKGGRTHIDTTDERPGAMIIYRELIARRAEIEAS